MILGLLSDTHGDWRRTRHATQLFTQLHAEAIIHCGDVGGTDVIDQLAGWPAWVVLGNTDGSGTTLARYADTLNIEVCLSPPLRLNLANKSIAVFHGHEPELNEFLTAAEQKNSKPQPLANCDYIFHGHTHCATDVHLAGVRLINPGALYRTRTPTIATLNLHTDTLRFHEIHAQSEDDPIVL